MSKTVLAIDPGLSNTGWALLDSGIAVNCGLFQTSKGDGPMYKDMLARTVRMFWSIESLEDIDADAVVCEAKGGSKSSRAATAMATAQAIVACVFPHVDLILPQEVKKRVCGSRSASKDDVKAAVIERWPAHRALIESEVGRAKSRQEHVYDAIAIGMAWMKGQKE